MSEARAQSLFSIVRQSADAEVVAAMEALIRNDIDRELCRVNVLDFAAKRGLDEERVIAAFLHAARVGIFELSWNVLCPGCGGVLDATATLRSIHKEAYECALCAAGYEPTLDEMVEVTFTVSPQVRRIAAHDPNTLPIWDYFRQIFWSSGIDLPGNFDELIDEITIDSVELPPGERALISLQLPAEFVIVFEPVTHANKVRAPTGTMVLRPGPLRLSIDNRTDVRVLPSVWIAGDPLHDLLGKRKPFLTAKRLLSNQTFRDIYRTDMLDVDQGLKITSLTFLFTDLKGSTGLYERVGDLVAYDLVRAHFRLLHEIVASEAGAVVKTIGDAVMATFSTPDRALAAALRMRDAMPDIKGASGAEELLLKIGIHEGPCLAVTLNDRLDYFGQTVNIAARVQGLAVSTSIFATGSVVEHPVSAKLLSTAGLTPEAQRAALRGIADEMTVYEIP